MIANMNERTSRNRLLAAILVFAMAVCVLTAIIPAAETDAADGGYENITPDAFLDLTKDNVITLEKSYNVTGTVTVSSDLKVVMNHNSLTTSGDLFSLGADGVTLEIVGDEDSSITAGQTGQASVVWGNHNTGTLVVTGGTYSADYALVWCGTGDDGTVTIQDATINGVTTGIWISYESNKSLTIDDCTVTAAGTGIYCGTTVEASITNTDVTVVGGGTALEIKAGTVTVEDSTFVSDGFEVTNGQINNNGSGAGVATIFINNGYTGTAGVEGVDVTITDCVVENSASETPVQIAVGDISSSAATGNIKFSSNCVTPTQIALYYSALSQTAEEPRTITVEYTGTQDTPEIDNITGAITSEQAGSGNILVVTTSIDDDATKSLTNGTTLIVSGGATYSGDISIDSEGAVSINGGAFTGTITTPANGDSSNTAVLDGVSGSIRITQGSIAIEGDFDAGTMTVTGEATLTGDVTIGDGATLTLNEGTTLNLNGYTLIVESGGTIAGSGTIDVTSGTFESAGGTTTVTFAHNRNTMEVNGISGEYTIARGSIAITGEFTTTSNGTITITGQARLTGNVTIGSNVTLSVNEGASLTTGTFALDVSNAAAVENNGTITIAANTTLTVGTDNFTNGTGGVIELYGTITGTSATVMNNGIINVYDGASYTGVKYNGSGSIDLNGVSTEGVLGGTYGTTGADDMIFPADQIVTLVSDTYLVNDINMTFNGTLVIPEGMTLTISDTALVTLAGQTSMIVNNGTIIILAGDETTKTNVGLQLTDGAKVQNNGTITVQYTPEDNTDTGAVTSLVVDSNGSAIVNDGSITAGENTSITLGNVQNNGEIIIAGTVDAGNMVNTANAYISFDGTVTGGTIENAGTIDIDATTTGQRLTISASAFGATVNVESVQGIAIQIDDAGINDSELVANTDANTVRIVGLSDYSLGGITVVSDSYQVGTGSNAETYKTLDVSGNVTATYTGTATGNSIPAVSGIGITLSGDITVSDTFTTCNGLALNIGYSGTPMDLTVSGTMDVVQGTAVANPVSGSSITVTGMLTSVDVEFGEEGVLLNAAVYSIDTPAVPAVGTTPAVPGYTTYYYTTLENAIASGATAISAYGAIEVTDDITIPNGTAITQVDQTGLDSVITIVEDATVTIVSGGSIVNADIVVDGTLYAEVESTGLPGTTHIVSEVRSSDGTDVRYTNLVVAMDAAESGDTIELNGDADLTLTSFTIKNGVTLYTNEHTLTVSGTTLTIDGTLYLENVSDYVVEANESVNSVVILNGYIMSEDNLSYSTAETNKAFPAGAYYSMVGEGGVTYNYISTVANAAAIIDSIDANTFTVYGSVNVGEQSITSTVTDGGYVNIAANAVVTGTITLNNVQVSVVSGGKIVGGVTDGVGTFITTADTVFGSVSYVVTDDGLTVSGSVSEATISGTVYLSSYSNDAAVLNVSGTMITAGAVAVGTINIEGTVTVSAGTTLTAGTAVVEGTLQTATQDSRVGTARVTTLYVGCELSNGNIVTGATGTVSGNVVLYVAGSTGQAVAYVASGSTVPETFSGTTYVNTQFMDNGSLWMTVYGTSGASIDYIAPVYTNADFKGWATTEDATAATITSADDIVLGSDYAILYSVIDFNVYTIEIYTDGGINSIALNGILMTNNGGNMFTMDKLAAGTYTVTYTLKSGFEGTPTMTIQDGATVSGDSFTITGGNDRTITVNMTGTTPSSSGGQIVVNTGSDDMSLTDILLIVLVVLIVIMAVIVALRLMRS